MGVEQVEWRMPVDPVLPKHVTPHAMHVVRGQQELATGPDYASKFGKQNSRLRQMLDDIGQIGRIEGAVRKPSFGQLADFHVQTSTLRKAGRRGIGLHSCYLPTRRPQPGHIFSVVGTDIENIIAARKVASVWGLKEESWNLGGMLVLPAPERVAAAVADIVHR